MKNKRIESLLILLSLILFAFSFLVYSSPAYAWDGGIVNYLEEIQGPAKSLSPNGLFFTFPYAKKYVSPSPKFLDLKPKNYSPYSENYDKYYYNNGENRITIHSCYWNSDSGRIDTGFVAKYGFNFMHPYAIHTISGLNWTYWDGSYPEYAQSITLDSKWVAHGINIMKDATVSVGYPTILSVSHTFKASYVEIGYTGYNIRSMYFRYGEDYSAPITFKGEIFNIEQKSIGEYTFNCSGSGYNHLVTATETVYIS